MTKNYDVSAKKTTHFERKMARKARKQEKLQQILLQMEKQNSANETKNQELKDILGLQLSGKTNGIQATKEIASISNIETPQEVQQLPAVNWDEGCKRVKTIIDSFMGDDSKCVHSPHMYWPGEDEEFCSKWNQETGRAEYHQHSRDNLTYTIKLKEHGVVKKEIVIRAIKNPVTGEYGFLEEIKDFERRLFTD